MNILCWFGIHKWDESFDKWMANDFRFVCARCGKVDDTQ